MQAEHGLPAMNSGTGVFDPFVDASGTYTYSLNACGGGFVTADVVVTVNSTPIVDLGADTVLCHGQYLNFFLNAICSRIKFLCGFQIQLQLQIILF